MGSNSNRSMSEDERVADYAKKISSTRDTSSSSFQWSTGAEIRGMMGVEKGNAFIAAIKNASR